MYTDGKEILYTLDEAKKVLAWNKSQWIKQRIIGMMCVVSPAISAFLMEDITIGVFMIPLGAYIIFSKDKISL